MKENIVDLTVTLCCKNGFQHNQNETRLCSQQSQQSFILKAQIITTIELARNHNTHHVFLPTFMSA
jgi:hypothetical protein